MFATPVGLPRTSITAIKILILGLTARHAACYNEAAYPLCTEIVIQMVSNNPVAGNDEPIEGGSPLAVPNDEAVAAASSATADMQGETPITSAELPVEPAAHLDALNADDPVDNAKDEVSEEAAQTLTEAMLDQHAEPRLRKGEILEGVVASTTPTEILIDLGTKAEGVVSGKELERMDRETLEKLKPGEKVLVYVLNPENKAGRVVLSLSRAAEEYDWRQAEELRQSGEVYYGKIDGYNKGGLIVRFGRVRGFVPESQVSRDRRQRAHGTDPQEKWDSMRGEDITVKVLEVDRGRNRLILSERDAAPKMREAKKEALLDNLQIGQRITGRVKSLADFGAFVDVGGADGLVHLTEMSWKHVTKPADILKVGQEVNVEVISIDRDRRRIGLSIKRTEEDPWMAVTRKYHIGDLVQGTITKLTKFGAFARLVENPEIEGLIHISELAPQRVGHPKEVVREQDVLTLRVVKIDPENRRLGLSIKKVASPDYAEADYKRATDPTFDYVDFEAATLKEEERRRAERKKGGGKKGKKGGKGEFGFEEFDDDYR